MVDAERLNKHLQLVGETLHEYHESTENGIPDKVFHALSYITEDIDEYKYNERELQKKGREQGNQIFLLEGKIKELEKTVDELGELSQKIVDGYVDLPLYEKSLLLAKLDDFARGSRQAIGIVWDVLAV